MLSFKKSKLIISSLLFFLFSCGYQPLISVKQSNDSLFNSGKFEIFSPENDIGFQVRENLLTDFGFPKNPKYKIMLKNSLERRKSIVTNKNDITRYNLILNTIFNLIEINNNKIKLTKTFETETSFSASTNITGFKAQVAKVNAEKRLAYDIAEKIRIEILLLEKDLLN